MVATAPASNRLSDSALIRLARRRRAATPPERHAAIESQLDWLDETVRRTVAPGSAEEAIAAQADGIGLGLARCT
jgi:hypothetical protein